MRKIRTFLRHQGLLLSAACLSLFACITDLITTHIVLQIGGEEANPIMLSLLEAVGFTAFVWINIIGSMAIIIYAIGIPLYKKKLRYHKARYLPVLMVFVVRGLATVNNLAIYLA